MRENYCNDIYVNSLIKFAFGKVHFGMLFHESETRLISEIN